MNLLEERKWIQNELDSVADFWLNNGMDKVNGGIYTCLDKDGKVFSTDKSVWMQGRCGWIFACIGSTFKGPFHVPRCLIMVDKMIEEIEKRG